MRFQFNLAKWLFISLLLFCGSSKAENILAVTEYLGNYQKKMPDGKLSGYAVDVVNLLFELNGDKGEIRVLPWSRAYNIALSRPNTMIFSIARTYLREEKFAWVGHLAEEHLLFWAHSESPIEQINSWEELTQLNISVYLGTNPEQQLSAKGHKRLYSVDSPLTSLQMLLNGRVDLTLGSIEEIKFRLQRIGAKFNQVKPVYEMEELNSHLSIAFQVDSDKQLVARYRRAFAELEQNGTLRELKQKWQIQH